MSAVSEDIALAVDLVDRLNRLIAEEPVREAVEALILARVPVAEVLCDHPTIQVGGPGPRGTGAPGGDQGTTLGLLGLLNGIVGVAPAGPREGWGYVAAVYSAEGTLVMFRVLEAGRNETS